MIVSPTLASAIRLIDAVMNPTCPAESSSTGRMSGENTPTCWTSKDLPLDMKRIRSPGRTRPSNSRT